MSVLAPLYFVGALAIGLPILFHLIRRTPRGQVEFSSLMFLQPTPPRLTRRSRLDHWFLLLLRALALILLAAAFARPFLRTAVTSDAQAAARRMVLLIDTSASMQRENLWQQALDHAGDVIDDLAAGDQLAIVTFDGQPQTIFGFDQSTRLAAEQLQGAARSSLAEVVPTWKPTDLGRAIAFAADLAVTYEPDSQTDDPNQKQKSALTGPAHMILVSDMQEGARIESLQAYAWPDQLQLDIRRVKTKSPTNAFARVLSSRDQTQQQVEADKQDRIRVRVENASASQESRFRLAWSGSGGESISELPVQVPPGESRVLRMPLPSPDVTSLVIRDDAHSFDNQRYLVSPQPESLSILYVGDDKETGDVDQQRESLLHYLRLIPLSNVRRQVTIETSDGKSLPASLDPGRTPLVVVSKSVEPELADRLKQYIESGGQVLFVLATEESQALSPALQRITGAGELSISEAELADYAMLSRIDFGNPVFASLADPKFNDFTKIHFWSHRTVSGASDGWSVLASFDDGQPALLEHGLGDGTLWVLTAGWQPSASQLALSTKFIPLVFNFFDAGSSAADTSDQYTVGGPIDLQPSPTAKIAGPDGVQFPFASSADADAIDQPGVYYYNDGDEVRGFAVNLAVSESRTDVLPEDALERFGISLGKTLSNSQIRANQRQLRDIELEGRQRLWQWLILAALILLALETWLGGWLSRRQVLVSENA